MQRMQAVFCVCCLLFLDTENEEDNKYWRSLSSEVQKQSRWWITNAEAFFIYLSISFEL